DRVEHRGMTRQRVDPGEQQVRLEIVALAEQPAIPPLEPLESVAEQVRFLAAKRVDREQEAVAVVLRNPSLRENSTHAAPLTVDQKYCSSLRGATRRRNLVPRLVPWRATRGSGLPRRLEAACHDAKGE